MNDYVFIDKALFFPRQGILAVGDLHLGYEEMLRESGILVPGNQIKETINDLKKIFKEIKKRKSKLKKIVLLGDIKHFFNYEKEEKVGFFELMNFLKKYFDEKDIILIKGNHDTFSLSDMPLKDYYIYDGIAFLHGHKFFPEILDKKIKTIVLAHLHLAITLSDEQDIRKEKYRCFLTGKWKRKQVIIVPHFLNLSEGTDILEYYERDGPFIIPKKELRDFQIHVIGKDRIYDFGKIKDMA